MKNSFSYSSIVLYFLLSLSVITDAHGQDLKSNELFQTDHVLNLMHRVNNHFTANQWKQVDRNWIRATYLTGLMAFYDVSHDSLILQQALKWGQKHGWRVGTEWIYPANRLTCSQTYLQLYEIFKNPNMIEETRSFMDKRVGKNESAFDAGWDYVDALYVGTPAYIMMSAVAADPDYNNYATRIFRELTDSLYDSGFHLFYRDIKAKEDQSRNGKPVLWSRGNGWAFASIPRILAYLPQSDSNYMWYVKLFEEMAESLIACQGSDGFWRTNLADPDEYPNPESSGTAFFTFGLAWGINNGLLNKDMYLPSVIKGWQALYSAVDENGKVQWGQGVARKPGPVNQSDSREFVAGAFLLAASEIFQLMTLSSQH